MLAKTPPMGWNSWNTFGPDINEKVILENADAFVALGLPEAGYEYIVIDDCWSLRDRDPETGKIVPDPAKFPHGMKYVSDYIHSKGLKFGMYSCAGTRTCADYPGSFDHEFLDAKTFAEYGCDFLKYDFCFMPETANGPLMYRRMGMALKASGREILFSACNWGSHEVHKWIRSTGAHMYRSTGDIHDNFESMKQIALSQENLLGYSAPGCFNDTDMLTVGMFGKGLVGTSGCTEADYRTQFGLWCMFSAPLMLGCDIRTLSPEMLALVKNKNLIRINQDEEARPPMESHTGWGGDKRVYFKHLSGGEYAIGFFNLTDKDQSVQTNLTNFGLSASSGLALSLTDTMTDEHYGTFAEYINVPVPAHDCRIFLCKLVEV